MVVEDAHLADSATVDLVRHLAHGTRHVGVLLVVTQRPASPTEPWFDVVALDGDDAGADEVPAEVRARLERVAVLGDVMRYDEALAAAGAPVAEAQRAIEVAVAARLLEREGPSVRFAAPGQAAALRARLAPEAQAEVQRLAADQLIAQGAEAGTVADRLLAAGDLDVAGPYLLAAAQAAAERQDHRAVLDRTAPDVADPVVRRALLELHADALSEVGDVEGVRCFRELVATDGPTPDPWLRARLARALIRVNDVAGPATRSKASTWPAPTTRGCASSGPWCSTSRVRSTRPSAWPTGCATRRWRPTPPPSSSRSSPCRAWSPTPGGSGSIAFAWSCASSPAPRTSPAPCSTPTCAWASTCSTGPPATPRWWSWRTTSVAAARPSARTRRWPSRTRSGARRCSCRRPRRGKGEPRGRRGHLPGEHRGRHRTGPRAPAPRRGAPPVRRPGRGHPAPPAVAAPRPLVTPVAAPAPAHLRHPRGGRSHPGRRGCHRG